MGWGSLIGAIFGAFVLGIPGAIFGLAVGYWFDSGLAHVSKEGGGFWRGGFAHRSPAQAVFFNSVFTVMGHLAKADGRVSENEIKLAEAIIVRMGLDGDLRKKAIDAFSHGKRDDFQLVTELETLRHAAGHNPVLINLFVNTQIQMAYADGQLAPQERAALETIAQVLKYDIDFVRMEAMYGSDKSYRRYREQPGQRKQAFSSLDQAYAVLNLSRGASPQEVKKAYRRLMSQHHPDKLVAKGLPKEMIQLATERTQEIRAAYEMINQK